MNANGGRAGGKDQAVFGAPKDQAVFGTQVSIMDLPGDCTTRILLQAAKRGSTTADNTKESGQRLAMTMLPPYGLKYVSAKVATAPCTAMLSLVNAR